MPNNCETSCAMVKHCNAAIRDAGTNVSEADAWAAAATEKAFTTSELTLSQARNREEAIDRSIIAFDAADKDRIRRDELVTAQQTLTSACTNGPLRRRCTSPVAPRIVAEVFGGNLKLNKKIAAPGSHPSPDAPTPNPPAVPPVPAA